MAPGTFIAAVGADSQGKQELEPTLVAAATLVVAVAGGEWPGGGSDLS